LAPSYDFTHQNLTIFVSKSNQYDVAYAGSEVLPIGKSPFTVLPNEYYCEVSQDTHMPLMTASFSNQTYQTYLIDNNAKWSLLWSDNCFLSQELADNPLSLACSSSPTFVNETFKQDPASAASYSSYTQAGYTTKGMNVRGSLQLPIMN